MGCLLLLVPTNRHAFGKSYTSTLVFSRQVKYILYIHTIPVSVSHNLCMYVHTYITYKLDPCRSFPSDQGLPRQHRHLIPRSRLAKAARTLFLPSFVPVLARLGHSGTRHTPESGSGSSHTVLEPRYNL
jgi:hypothetical protein